MKRFLWMIFLLANVVVCRAQISEQEVDEVTVTAESQSEGATTTFLYPSTQDRRHSVNVYQLLENMHIIDIEADGVNNTANTIDGRSVVFLRDGIEMSANEVVTLPIEDIKHLEYQRFPGGKYVGQGAVVNIITYQYKYGGNVYLSATEGLVQQYGKYLLSSNYKSGAWKLSALLSASWGRSSMLTDARNIYNMSDGAMYENLTTLSSRVRSNNEYGQVKLSHAEGSHNLDITFSFSRQGMPNNSNSSLATYSGTYSEEVGEDTKKSETNISPSLSINYSLWMDNSQYFGFNAQASYTKNNYKGRLQETNYTPIETNTEEKNWNARIAVFYYKYLSDKANIGVTADVAYQNYKDQYDGTVTSNEKLSTVFSRALVQWQHTPTNKFYYYVSAGMSNTYADIVVSNYTYWNPTLFYGANLALSSKHALSLSGTLMYTTFNPEYKNSIALPTSFFQLMVGNADLKNMGCFQNTLSYNGHLGHFNLSVMYDFMVYMNNITNKYYLQDDKICQTLVNDGHFYSNRFIISGSYSALNNTLRVGAKAVVEMYYLRGSLYDVKQNDVRLSFDANYYLHDWRFQAELSTPYTTFGMREPSYFKEPLCYGLNITYSKRQWQIGLSGQNFARKYHKSHTRFDYGVQDIDKTVWDSAKGCNIVFSMVFHLGYGKKTEETEKDYNSNIYNAILKPF